MEQGREMSGPALTAGHPGCAFNSKFVISNPIRRNNKGYEFFIVVQIRIITLLNTYY
jgi:hypothetical protein